jgi:hypothetical protein
VPDAVEDLEPAAGQLPLRDVGVLDRDQRIAAAPDHERRE